MSGIGRRFSGPAAVTCVSFELVTGAAMALLSGVILCDGNAGLVAHLWGLLGLFSTVSHLVSGGASLRFIFRQTPMSWRLAYRSATTAVGANILLVLTGGAMYAGASDAGKYRGFFGGAAAGITLIACVAFPAILAAIQWAVLAALRRVRPEID